MGTDSVTISPASAGAGSAVLGIGAGYVLRRTSIRLNVC